MTGTDHSPARRSRLRGSFRALTGRLGEQWERDRRDTLFLMAGTLMSAAPHLPHLPWWTGLAFLGLFAWRLGLVFTGRMLPPDALRWGGALASIAAVYAHYDSLVGRDAGVTLLLLFLGLKLMEMRARRDLFVVLFLCFFLLLATFFHSQSAMVAAWTVLTTLVLVGAMVTMQFGKEEAPIPRRLRTAAVLLAQALPIAAALFVLFPRLQTPLWGLPEDSFSGRTGLSDSMAPGRIARLGNSDEVAFRVRFDGLPPAEAQMYWRGPVFGLFDGETWTAAPRLSAPVAPQVQYERRTRPIRYAVTVEASHRSSLFALDVPVRFDERVASESVVAPDLQFLARNPVGTRTRYEVESRLDYRVGLNETPESLSNWQALPPGYNPRARALAAEWAETIADPRQRVERLMRLFAEQPFRYTLTPPTLGRDGIDEFLFGTRAGFCEHYAGALVFMARAMGVPARVVTGYQGAEPNPVDDYWIVRQADAHAWAEVWLPQRGWVRYDPVTAVAPERIERGSRASRMLEGTGGLASASAFTRHLRLNLDAFTNSWNQWVLSYDASRQQRLVAGLGLSFDDWRNVAGLLATVLALLIGGAAMFTLHPTLQRDPVERLFRSYCDRLATVGLDRIPHETAARHLERIARGLDAEQLEQAGAIVSLYNNLRYANVTVDASDVQHLRSLVKHFRP